MTVKWDAHLSKEISDRWYNLVSDIGMEPSVAINRSVLSDIPSPRIKSITLHGFSDASQIAYGGSVYLIIKTDESSHTELLASKSKLAPLKGETIPWLELMVALVVVQLINSIETAFKTCVNIDSIVCWSDSTVVLHWLNGKANMEMCFVENRVRQITSLVEAKNLTYCPSQKNPANIVSRGASISNLANNKLWWDGPDFLTYE